jgi:hypothetical protein
MGLGTTTLNYKMQSIPDGLRKNGGLCGKRRHFGAALTFKSEGLAC